MTTLGGSDSESVLASHKPDQLRRAATRGTVVLGSTHLLTYAVSFGSTLVLARLLSPQQFGEVALALVIAEFLFLLAGMSLPIALIREPDSSIKVAFNTSIVLMCGITVVVAVISALIGIGLFHWYSLTLALVFGAISASRILFLFGALFLADLERRLLYGRFAIAQSGSTLLSIVVAIALGYAGAGVWALASREIVSGCSIFAIALLFVRWRPRWVYDRAKVRELLRFGVGMLGSRLGDVMFHRFDNLMVGTLAGSATLGLYNQAYLLTEVGVRIFSPAIFQVSMPTYAKLQGDRGRSSRAFRVIAFFLSRAVIPINVLFLVIPGQVLGVVLGAQWQPAETMLRVLGVYGLLIPLVEHMRVVLIANGAIREMLIARIIQLAFFVPATVGAAWLWGGEGTAVVVAFAVVLGGASVYYFARRLVDIPERDFIAPTIGGLSAAAVLVVVSRTFSGDGVVFMVGTVLVLTVFITVLVALERARILENVGIVRVALRERSRSDELLTPDALTATIEDVAPMGMARDRA